MNVRKFKAVGFRLPYQDQS